MKRFIHYLITASSFTTLCLLPSTAEAIFASVKSTGMAATSISYPIDSLAGAYNPAGIASVGNRFDLEAAWLRDTGHATIHGNLIPGTNIPSPVNGRFDGMKTKDIYPAGFGLSKTWNVNCNWDIAAGLILYNRNYQKTTYGRPLPLFGTSKPGLEYLHETVSSILAVKLYDSHTIGMSVNFQLERIKVNGLENFDNIFRSVAPGHVTNKGYGYAHGWGVTLGYYGQITNCLSIGATYQPQTNMSRITKYKGFLAEHGRLDIPRKIGAGIAYRFTPCLVVAFDIEHIHWKPIKSLSNNFPSSERLGASRGPGFGFVDQIYYRIGLEWRFEECLTARVGFRHARTPIKKSQTAVNILTLDTVQDFATAGLTWEINSCNEISFLGAYGFRHGVKGKNSIPLFFGGGEVDLKEQKFALGIAWGWKY